MNSMNLVSSDTYLAHYGIKGQKWGVRRYQNADGTLTESGKKHYTKDSKKFESRYNKALKRAGLVNKRSKSLRRATNRSRWIMSPERIANKEASLNKSKKRYERSLNRANRMYRRLERRYGGNEISNLSQDIIGKGRDIATRLNALEMSF